MREAGRREKPLDFVFCCDLKYPNFPVYLSLSYFICQFVILSVWWSCESCVPESKQPSRASPKKNIVLDFKFFVAEFPNFSPSAFSFSLFSAQQLKGKEGSLVSGQSSGKG